MVFRARLAVTAIFALNGVMFASLFARLPAIQDRTDVGDGALGLALLCAMLGLVLSQPVAGALVARAGSRPVVVAGAIAYAVGLVPVATSESLIALVIALTAIGFGSGLLDVSMNVHGLTVERELGRPVLSTMHAAFSFGALAGAGLSALVIVAGAGVVAHLTGTAVFGVAAALALAPFLLPSEQDASPGAPVLALPTRALAAVGAIAFCVLLAEGAVNDWAAIYLRDEVGTGEAVAAMGLAAFSLTMGIGRLAGDRLGARMGPDRLARAGATLALAGIAIALGASGPVAAVSGFAVMGLGLAALFPLALRAAALRGETVGPSVAAVSGLGYLGLLSGPPAVGGLSELLGLRAALVLVALVLAVVTLLARALRTPVAVR